MTVSIVTIEQYATQPSVQLSDDDVLEVRGWYNRSFIAGDGVTPVEANVSNGALGPYYSITPTLNGSGYLVVPAHDVQATTLSNPTAGYTEQLWVNGTYVVTLMPNTQASTGWQIPTTYGTTIAFDEIATYNRARRLVYPPNTYFTADETIAEIRRLADDQAYAAVGVNGITSIDVAPEVASLPISVGANSYASTDHRGIASIYPDPDVNSVPLASGVNNYATESNVGQVLVSAVPETSAAVRATGTFPFSGNPSAGDFITVNGAVFTYRVTATDDYDIQIGVDASATKTATVTVLNNSTDTRVSLATYFVTGSVLVRYDVAGQAGNLFTLAAASSAISVSGPTLTGGVNANVPTAVADNDPRVNPNYPAGIITAAYLGDGNDAAGLLIQKVTGFGNAVRICPAGATGGVVGIGINGGTNTVTYGQMGYFNASFDSTFGSGTSNGCYVGISATVAGNCTVLSSVFPTSEQVIGRILDIGIGTNQAVIELFGAEVRGTGVYYAADYSSFNAAIMAIGSTPATLVVSTALIGVTTASVPATLALRFVGGGSLSITTGQTLTILGAIDADAVTIFNNALSGQGTVSVTGNTRLTEIFPQWWGAVLDNATDDSAAINACIVSLGSTSTTRGGPRVVITGPAAIASTILINRKSIEFDGLGWGRQGSTGQQSYLRWIGSAGSPMLRIQNAQGTFVRDLRLIGNASAKPSCAISFFQQAGFGMSRNFLENIAIGDLADGTAIGTGFTNGIACEGTLQNNAEWVLENIYISGCSGVGIRQSSTQNVNWQVNGLTVASCATGIYITGSIGGNNWNFSANTTTDIVRAAQDDAPNDANPIVEVTSLFSEGSAQLLVVGKAGLFAAHGGSNQVGSFTVSDGKIVKAEGNGTSSIKFTDFNLAFQQSSPPTTPFISIKKTSNTFTTFTELVLESVGLPSGGPNSNGIDAATLSGNDTKHIRYIPASQPVPGSGFAVQNAVEMWLNGVNGGGENFDTTATTDIPSRLRTVPTLYQDITAAGDAILLNATLRVIKNNTAGSITLTSTPTIPVGRNGEVITVINVGAQNVVLQDNGTLVGSKLKLTGTTITLGQYDSVKFLYLINDGTQADIKLWIQIGPVVNVL
jgi:hypothetical protein